MNVSKFTIAIAIALLGSATAHAVEATQDFTHGPQSTRSRSEVKAEFAQARAAGLLAQRGEAYGSFEAVPFVSTKTRAEVVAEFNAARQAGELDTWNETYGSFPRHEIASTKTRAEVRAEVRQAIAAGARLSHGDNDGL